MKEPSNQQALKVLAVVMLGGLLSVPLYALHHLGDDAFLRIIGIGGLLAGGSCFVGGLLGFLFGIPRTLQGSDAEEDKASAKNDAGPRLQYRANTNLEQISDWFTKILVGVGLTQLGEIRDGFGSLADFVAPGLGAQDDSRVFALALICFFVVVGFLFGYLWTRLFLASAMRAADESAIGRLAAQVQKVAEKVDTTQEKLDDLKKQNLVDAEALNFAHRVLNPVSDLPAVTQEELNASVLKASPPVRVQILNQAWSNRSENWRDARDKMERSIPLFRALINSDTENRYHLNHGQLGFALKDKAQPDFAEAERELSTAIKLRGPWMERGWLFYEFNRAVCRIANDPDFAREAPSSTESRTRILEDLKAAMHAEDMERVMKSEGRVQKWLLLNGMAIKDLGRRR